MNVATLERGALVTRLLRERDDDLLVVGGLGSACYDILETGEDPRNFGLWGAMGQAAAIGLGLALAQPGKRVLVITGDGEMLMGLGALATIADQAPQNLAILVLDNGLYAETGGQRSHTGGRTDLAEIARGAGFAAVSTVREAGELATAEELLLRTPGPVLVVAKVAPKRYGRPANDHLRDGRLAANRFRIALLGEAEAMRKVD